jgi:pyruvate,water dikinase
MTTSTREFVAPGKGPWELETAHFPRPISRFAGELFIRAFPKGFAESSARYGLLLSHFKGALVNNFIYQQPVAFGAPEGAEGPPPKPILWLLTRLHPKMRARIADCERAFETKLWRSELKRWDDEARPDAIKKHKAIQAIDPATLDDTELAAYVERCAAHAEAMILLHHQFTVTCIIATGDFLAHAADWTGASHGELLGLLRGTSPISNGVAAGELDALAEALKADAAARGTLAGDDPARALADLSEHAGPVGDATRAYLDVVRHRSIGYDICDKTSGEMPELLVKAIRAASGEARVDTSVASREDELRKKVPAEHREQFDELLKEARSINRLRDERGVYSDGWGTGLARRAVLEAGRRLQKAGKLHDCEHAVDLTGAELASLLNGGEGPSADEVLDHVTWRKTKSAADAPPFLNSMPGGPPPADLLPAPARRAVRAIDAVLSNLFKDSEAKNTAKVLKGISVNRGVYEGTARLVGDVSEFEKLQQGDVLVTRATSPYFNVVLPLLGALVTDRGGQLCHAAIVAREYGIPGIVGTRDATKQIKDGMRIRVDGEKGEVTLLEEPS